MKTDDPSRVGNYSVPPLLMGWGGNGSRFPAPTVRPEIAQGKRGFARDALGNRPPTAKALKGRDPSGDPMKSRCGNVNVGFCVGPSGLGGFS